MNLNSLIQKRASGLITIILSLLILFTAGTFLFHGWKEIHIDEPTRFLHQTLNRTSDAVVALDLQIEVVKKKLQNLDPGPPPAWYSPSYYYDWLPRSKIYYETQETLFSLRKFKKSLETKSIEEVKQLGKVWNVGIAPILHFMLGISLLMLSMRMILRMALIQGMFRWTKL